MSGGVFVHALVLVLLCLTLGWFLHRMWEQR